MKEGAGRKLESRIGGREEMNEEGKRKAEEKSE